MAPTPAATEPGTPPTTAAVQPLNVRRSRPAEIASYALTGLALVFTITLDLLPALLAGLLVYELVHMLAPRLRIGHIHRRRRKVLAVGLLAGAIGVIILGGIIAMIVVVQREGSAGALLRHMADAIETSRARLTAAVAAQMPEGVDRFKTFAVDWLRTHAGADAGGAVGRALVHILIGLVVGGLVALQDVRTSEGLGPLAWALQRRAARLGDAFRRVVFGQVRISAINALLTGLYLLVALPLFGIHLPLRKTMIVVTFLVGLLPVIGNLVSNTVIVVLSLSVSVQVAIASLVFLVVIHKLEYFLNAHIIGVQVHAHAWELLIAMLVMEAAFGAAGLIAAPVYYAYLKDELVRQELV